MADSGGDKKHAPTERRRQKAREEGNVVKSQDLTSAVLLMAAVATLWTLGDDAAEQIAVELVDSLSTFDIATTSHPDGIHHLGRGAMRLAVAVVPILVVMFAAAVVINVAQTGWLLSTAKLVPKLSNISPASGVKRIASIRGVMRLGFGIFKVAVIAVVAYVSLATEIESVMSLATLTTRQVATVMFRCVMATAMWIGVALLVLALAEWAFQKWKHEQDLMMTDQEVRDEMKETNGDPQMVQRRRQIQRQMLNQRAETEVPKADVVVSNPTELAVAIQYDPMTMPAPIVLAKGAGPLAQKIRRLALENGVPVVERKPLARALYADVEIGAEVPAEQYQAVAEVLRYVYQLQGKEVPRAA